MVDLFQKSWALAKHAERKTLNPSDIILAMNIMELSVKCEYKKGKYKLLFCNN